MLEKHNRKSHLAPQLSPATQALLKGSNTASPSLEYTDSTASTTKTPTKTPTSSEIPIANDNNRAPQTATSEPPMSSRITDFHGSLYPEQTLMYDTPNYPPRTSSSMSHTSNRSRPSASHDSYGGYPPESGAFNQTLPIRPAPPTGPLPRRPSSSQPHPNPVTANGTSYHDYEKSQYH